MLVVPSKNQIIYQKDELIAFIHFGINTFTDKEWGDGKENPKIFNPKDLDVNQWIYTLYISGFKKVIITTKHHDGFCLWPSSFTNHSIKNSPYKNGKGNIVKEVYDACCKYGLKFGIYLSLWDQNSIYYGKGEAYNKYYINQLKELLNNYPSILEIWMDGAKDSKINQDYDFDRYFKVIKKLQPNCMIFSPVGPDIRWIGNERGYAGEPFWSTIDISKMKIKEIPKYLNTGDPKGTNWVVGEADVSIRPGWFYHESENSKVKTLNELKDIYFNSVGRNAVLLLNVCPNKEGKLYKVDINNLKSFSNWINRTFSNNLLKGSSIKSKELDQNHSNLINSNYDDYCSCTTKTPTIEISFEKELKFNIIQIQEYIPLGQRIFNFKIYCFIENNWQEVYKGQTIGYKRLILIDTVKASKIKIEILDSIEKPILNNVSIYFDKNSK